MKFSIVIPTRGNLSGLKDTLDSLLRNTRNLRELEVLLIMDRDDQDLEKIFALCEDYAFNITCYVRPRTKGHFCDDYYNWGAEKTKGENIMMFNDDALILTPHWDDIVLTAIGERVVYMLSFMDSTYHDGKLSYPKFPMVSRRAYEALGCFFHPEIRMWGADNWLYSVHKEAGTIIECHQIEIQHNHVLNPQFGEWFEINKKETPFPYVINRQVVQLLEARGKYDRTRT